MVNTTTDAKAVAPASAYTFASPPKFTIAPNIEIIHISHIDQRPTSSMILNNFVR